MSRCAPDPEVALDGPTAFGANRRHQHVVRLRGAWSRSTHTSFSGKSAFHVIRSDLETHQPNAIFRQAPGLNPTPRLTEWLTRSLTRTSLNHPVCMMWTIPAASLRSLLLITISSTALACRASMQITGRSSRLSSVHTHVAVGPVSRPIRTAPGACDLTNSAMASGSESTTPSRTTDPIWFTTQIDVCFDDTSSPT